MQSWSFARRYLASEKFQVNYRNKQRQHSNDLLINIGDTTPNPPISTLTIISDFVSTHIDLALSDFPRAGLEARA